MSPEVKVEYSVKVSNTYPSDGPSAAKAAAGITERVRTWYGWKQAGFMVKHGSKNLFQVELIAAAKGDGKTFRQSYFGESQVEPLEAATA